MVIILKFFFFVVETSYLHSMFLFIKEKHKTKKTGLGPSWDAPGPQVVKILKNNVLVVETSYLPSMLHLVQEDHCIGT